MNWWGVLFELSGGGLKLIYSYDNSIWLEGRLEAKQNIRHDKEEEGGGSGK